MAIFVTTSNVATPCLIGSRHDGTTQRRTARGRSFVLRHDHIIVELFMSFMEGGIDPVAACELLRKHAENKAQEARCLPSDTVRTEGQVIDLFTGIRNNNINTEEITAVVSKTKAVGNFDSKQDALKKVLEEQSERVGIIRRFDDALLGAVETRNASSYAKQIPLATQQLNEISKMINHAEAYLRSISCLVAADAIRDLQCAEKDHLELTVAAHLESLREQDSNDYLELSLRKAISRINDILETLRFELEEDDE